MIPWQSLAVAYLIGGVVGLTLVFMAIWIDMHRGEGPGE